MSTRGLSRQSLSRMRPIDRVALLAGVVAVLAGFFIITGSVPLLFLLPVVAALGLDGILRGHPASRLRGATTTATQLLLPAAFVVAAALFFRYVASGYWSLLASLATGALFTIVGAAAYASLDLDAEAGGLPRLVLVAAAYAGLYGLLAAFYAFDLSPFAAAVLAGVAGAIFAVELFREVDLASGDLALYAAASGFALAQVRWAAAYVRLDGLLAAMFLLLVFYVLTGLTLAAVTRKIERRVAVEYGLVGAIGVAIVIAGRLITGG